MATSYPSVAATDYAADDFATQTRTRGIRDAHECVARKPWALYFTEQTRTNTAYGDMYEFELLPMEFMVVAGRYFKGTVEAKVDAGTGTLCVVDADDSDTIISDEVEVTNTGSYADATLTVTVPSGWTAHTRRTLAIQGKATSGDTVYIQSINYIQWYCTD